VDPQLAAGLRALHDGNEGAADESGALFGLYFTASPCPLLGTIPASSWSDDPDVRTTESGNIKPKPIISRYIVASRSMAFYCMVRAV